MEEALYWTAYQKRLENVVDFARLCGIRFLFAFLRILCQLLARKERTGLRYSSPRFLVCHYPIVYCLLRCRINDMCSIDIK